MIPNFDIFNNLSQLSAFQAKAIDYIKPTLSRIDSGCLADSSYIEIADNRIVISICHKDDNNSLVSLNIFQDYIKIWYSECDIYIDKDILFGKFPLIVEEIILGNYNTQDCYFRNKLIFSSTNFLNIEIQECVIPYTFFYKLYRHFFSGKLYFKERLYKSFIN